ncbi:MarR family winged helix-turn-helix transcriptional regulator [Paenibacillus sp. NFR01]|uniref:MarR family winged helix-turn-helix transcriptional regulator n=1 Tax=Paenibacillus sp. NFR01 TaxID=1566279 RepID=UPI0008D19652|nr:MarR family transcriptional regulator [Paenibacillus sp. NFR01]SEU28994.1 DNA-binding transcriptional regulator, MarR family [Paenibacillus sp. NFR01]
MEEQERQLDEILTSFRRISQAYSQLLRKIADELEITSVQLSVLRKISMHPDVGVTELAELLHLGNSAASGIVDRMVKAGLITRDRCASDKRMYLLALTSKGQGIIESSRQALRRHLQPLLAVEPEDVDELLRLHCRIVQILEQGRENY